MNDARVEHIEETLNSLGQKVDGLGVQLHESTDRLDGKIDDLARQTQAGFDDHRLYAEFLNQGIREEMNTRFNRMERRFDSVDNRFDRLEQLIKER